MLCLCGCSYGVISVIVVVILDVHNLFMFILMVLFLSSLFSFFSYAKDLIVCLISFSYERKIDLIL